MALYTVSVGSKVAAEDLNQIVRTLRGLAANPVLLSGNWGSSYGLDVFANGSANMFRVRSLAGTMLNVTNSGVRISADGSNFDKVPVTTDGAQTLTGKVISGASNTITGLGTAAINDDAVTEPKIADDAVGSAQIADNAVLGRNMGYPDGVLLRRTTDHVLLSSQLDTWVDMTWDNEIFEYSSGEALQWHASGTEPAKKITCVRAGSFLVYFRLAVSPDTSGDWRVRLIKGNGGASGTNVLETRELGAISAKAGGGDHAWGGTHVLFMPMIVDEWIKIQVMRTLVDTNDDRTLKGGLNGIEFAGIRIGR